jgi:hypothetical protein
MYVKQTIIYAILYYIYKYYKKLMLDICKKFLVFVCAIEKKYFLMSEEMFKQHEPKL